MLGSGLKILVLRERGVYGDDACHGMGQGVWGMGASPLPLTSPHSLFIGFHDHKL